MAACYWQIGANRNYARTDFDRTVDLSCRATSTSCRLDKARSG